MKVGGKGVLYNIKLVHEDTKNSQRAYKAHQKEEDWKQPIAHSSPIGKLVLHHFLRNKPSYKQAGKETTDRQKNLSGNKIEYIKQRLAGNLQPSVPA